MDDKEKLEVVLLMIEREIESISKKLESEKDEDSTLFPEIVGHKRWVFLAGYFQGKMKKRTELNKIFLDGIKETLEK